MQQKIPIDIIAGFLGSGKTTLLNALLEGKYKGLRVAVIENEFGKIDVDSSLLPSDIKVTKITGGCVCCTLKISLIDGIKELVDRFDLDRIIIETTGVAKLSDVSIAIGNEAISDIVFLSRCITVINPTFHMRFAQNLGSFYNDQVQNASIIFISRKAIVEESLFSDVQSNLKDSFCKQIIYTDISDFETHIDIDGISENHGDNCMHGNHEHDHIESQQEFYSFVADIKKPLSKDELLVLIDQIVDENKPNHVYRIKGSASVDGKGSTVQWVNGVLDLRSIRVLENKLVVVVGRADLEL